MNWGNVFEDPALDIPMLQPAYIHDKRARTARASAIAAILWAVLARTAPLSAQSPAEDNLPARSIVLAPVQLVPDSPVVVITYFQMQELEQWTRDFAAWQEWANQWLNRRQSGQWSNGVERKERPAPPAWLEDVCELLAADEPFVRACQWLARWRQDPIALKSRHAATVSTTQREKPTKTVWWQHVHVDGLWSTTQTNVSAFGLVGTHLTWNVAGRLQVFVTPGILLVSVPRLSGNRELWPSTDWGVTYRLFNVGRSTVHFNLVHAWILGSQASLMHPSVTLAGFSITLRPSPR